MNNGMPLVRYMRVYILLVLVAGVLSVSGCATTTPVRVMAGVPTTDVVLLGATIRRGLKAPVKRKLMAEDMLALLSARKTIDVTPSTEARTILGGGPHDEMMAHYARHAQFAPYQIQRLMAANLPARHALVVRLEADGVKRLPVVRQPIIDARGLVVPGQEYQTFVTRRDTRLSASLLDLRNGRIAWTRQYRVSPERASSSTHFVGNSFPASVGAVVANTMVKGIRDTRYPKPSALGDSVAALLREVAHNVPIR